MTLVDLKTGKELKMPTGYDAFVREARPDSPLKVEEVKKNRTLLISVMSKYGFRVNSAEWWHFDFRGYQKYPVLDIAFEELEGNKGIGEGSASSPLIFTIPTPPVPNGVAMAAIVSSKLNIISQSAGTLIRNFR
jgi:hypothetical protein